VLVQGAEPLFFLDYFATGKLDIETTVAVVGGIAKGCEMAGCALIGGETAEMPDMYPAGEYDLAGFTVGAVEKSQLLDGSKEHAVAAAGCGDVRATLSRRNYQRSLENLANARPVLGTHGHLRVGLRDSRLERVFRRLMADRQSNQDVTDLLRQWQAGDADALDRLLPLVARAVIGEADSRV